MKIIFATNAFNHHQYELSNAFDFYSGHQFVFIETKPLSDERKRLGWGMDNYPNYIYRAYESKSMFSEGERLVYEADIVIIGNAPYELFERRLKSGKLTYIYSERIFKNKKKLIECPIRMIINYYKFNRYNQKYNNIFLLCASGYASSDYRKTGSFKDKALKWGYFPRIERTYNNVDEIISFKNKFSIIWVGRLISWKHPELVLEVAQRLIKDGYDFEINIIGTGELCSIIASEIKEKKLEKYVYLLGAKRPDEVVKYMERSQIALFTSDFNEGWGAVMNEYMGCACAVVASHAIGAAPFLIRHGENGLIYKNGDIDDLYNKTCYLLENDYISQNFGKEAYATIKKMWNADIAAKRLLTLSTQFINNKEMNLYDDGPCCKAERLKNNWFF